MTVDVYSDADEVELTLNGTSLGRRPAGPGDGYLASFTVPYQPGELTAVNRRHGEPAEETTLRSSGELRHLRVEVEASDRPTRSRVHEYVSIALTDEDGRVIPFDDRLVTVAVTGDLELLGLGSGRPSTEESYLGNECRTYQGRAQAVVRRVGNGGGGLSVESEGLDRITVVI